MILSTRTSILSFLLLLLLLALLCPLSCAADNETDPSNDFITGGPAPFVDQKQILPEEKDRMTRYQCMKCHPLIAGMLSKHGAAHRTVPCRACHIQYHVYEPGTTNYRSILPKCSRCHGHPHGDELSECSSCHSEAHTPLEIPASLALAQGCYVCHEKYEKEIKTYTTRHTELYCIACHHTKHGHIPQCLECHQPHTAIFPARTQEEEPSMQEMLAECVDCHPPHKALKANIPDQTSNHTCALCHREASETLTSSGTKHSRLRCTRCHPGEHRTIKRCRQCHSEPHPRAMLEKAGTCGACHGVAHSIIR